MYARTQEISTYLNFFDGFLRPKIEEEILIAREYLQDLIDYLGVPRQSRKSKLSIRIRSNWEAFEKVENDFYNNFNPEPNDYPLEAIYDKVDPMEYDDLYADYEDNSEDFVFTDAVDPYDIDYIEDTKEEFGEDYWSRIDRVDFYYDDEKVADYYPVLDECTIYDLPASEVNYFLKKCKEYKWD
ncbi:hypothetical protein IKG13_00805 [Candidatus Saccharibacteria bacterium]|nr:hypothetical protein [Candidatus Saccharibacteria bacterium]MBR3377941.1 hypothetical protein [Candidatus Saccharibacteria bacterium]